MTGNLEGGCACNAVRYRMEDAPIFTHCCHCRHCQRVSGSAFAVNTMIETGRLSVPGLAPKAVAVPSSLPAGKKLYRCPCCATALWSSHAAFGDQVAFVFVGTLDAPGRLPPTVHCYTASRQPWVTLGVDLPAYDGVYDTGLLWPSAAKARIAAAVGSLD